MTTTHLMTTAELRAVAALRRAQEAERAKAEAPRQTQDVQREEAQQQLYRLCANVDADLEAGYHLYDNQGWPMLHFDEWLQAAEAGRWPVESEGQNGD